MSNRLDQDREAKLQPERMEYAIKKLHALGYVSLTHDETTITFFHKGEKIKLFPYSGWHQGKGIVEGRGIDNLLKQLQNA